MATWQRPGKAIMAASKMTYVVYVDGELAAVGTKEQCACAVGIKPETVKSYACPSKRRPGAKLQVYRVPDGEAPPPMPNRRPEPTITGDELRRKMRERHDAMFGVGAGWEL